MSLTTTARVKAALGIPAAVTFHDVAIGNAVDYANAYVLRSIGQPGGLVATTRTDYPDVYVPNQMEVMLDRSPVVSIIAVTNASQLLAEGTDYRANYEDGYLKILRGVIGSRGVLAGWSDVEDDVVVTYLHGYTSATVPGELQRAADLIATHNSEQIRHVGKTEVRNSSYGFKVDQASIPDAAALILTGFQDVHHT